MSGNPFGNIIGTIGNVLGLPEFGISERLGSGPAQNQVGAANILKAVGQGNKPTVQQPKAVQGVDTPTDNPQPTQANPATYGSSSTSGTGGSSAFDPAAQAYYADQISQVQSAMNRLGNQRNIGNQNIDSQLNSALNKLLGQNATAERDFGINKQRTIDDNVNARAKVDENVSRQSAGLRRLLGNSSSASEFAAPLAVARQGNSQLGEIQTGYSRNLQSLDTADEDRKRAFQESQSDIQTQGQTQRNSLQAGLAEREAQLLDQMSQLQIQKAQSTGQDYNAARAATQGNNSRVNALLAQIDQLGLNPNIAAKSDLRFVAPELAKYQTSDINITPGASPLQSQVGQFYNLLGLDDQRKQNQL